MASPSDLLQRTARTDTLLVATMSGSEPFTVVADKQPLYRSPGVVQSVRWDDKRDERDNAQLGARVTERCSRQQRSDSST